jgi:hypothetical protein
VLICRCTAISGISRLVRAPNELRSGWRNTAALSLRRAWWSNKDMRRLGQSSNVLYMGNWVVLRSCAPTKEESGESKLAFHSQRLPPRESRRVPRRHGERLQGRLQCRVWSHRIIAVNTARHHASPSTTDSGKAPGKYHMFTTTSLTLTSSSERRRRFHPAVQAHRLPLLRLGR